MQDGVYYIFAEEALYSNRRGRIICLTLDDQLEIISTQVVLEQPYHLSYPFIFEFDGELYMLPETRQNNRIELYRCTKFPNQWVFERALIENIAALDCTLAQSNGKWWLFAQIPAEGSSKRGALHLFHADDPICGDWTPHTNNPVLIDEHSDRPAGRVFYDRGSLIRPGQDGSKRYGYATSFSRIDVLTESTYKETYLHCFQPVDSRKFQAVHTYNSIGGISVIDAILRRPRLGHRYEALKELAIFK